MTRKKLLSQRHSLFYFLSVWEKRIRTYLRWFFGNTTFSSTKSKEKLPCRVKKHQSVLIRRLGHADMQLQYNKVKNLKLALARIDGVLIKPGETFSFCKTVGLPTRRKGYLPGMELSRGEARAGIGGGICQISNLLHWLVMHTPLTIVERHHHGFDPFPDDRRVLPFGSGATIFYNYKDYCFTNATPYTFQIRLWLTKKCLEGEVRSSEWLDHSYHVFEKKHEFIKRGTAYYRKNEIWRKKICIAEANVVATELMTENCAEVKYVPETYREVTEQ